MSRRALLALLAIPVFLLIAIPAAAASRRASAPVVDSVYPLKLRLGHRLTIRGHGFIRGRHKDTVVFMGPGKRVVWVKADRASAKSIVVTLPARLAALLDNRGGVLQPTRLQVRVIARRSGRAFTKKSRSPIVMPASTTSGGSGGSGGCVPNPSDPSADSDGDFLPDQLEVALGTNPCNPDSDGDGVSDGYEYQAALDLNRNANSTAIPWPYPGKRPYPNPLYAGDANTDFDGDSLTLREEYTASFAWPNGLDPAHKLQTFVPYKPNPNPNNNVMVVSYSDGDQTTNPTAQGNANGDPTGPLAPANPGDQASYDVNGDGAVNASDSWGFIDANRGGLADNVGAYDPGDDLVSWFNYTGEPYLSDDEKDIDADGLSNYDESHGPMSGPDWWLGDPISKQDGTYYIPYTGTDWLNRDTDGDGIPDGSDDQDHDGYTNIEEDYGAYIAGPFMAYAATHDTVINVHAFNPCLPNLMSPACARHPVDQYAPFKPGSRQPTFSSWPAP